MHVELLPTVFDSALPDPDGPLLSAYLERLHQSAGPEVFSSDQGRRRPVSTMVGRFKALILQPSIRSVLNHRAQPDRAAIACKIHRRFFGSATVSRAEATLIRAWQLNGELTCKL